MAARRIEMTIDKCFECPHFCHYYICNLTNKELSFKQIRNGIPDDCPLPITQSLQERIEDIIDGNY